MNWQKSSELGDNGEVRSLGNATNVFRATRVAVTFYARAAVYSYRRHAGRLESAHQSNRLLDLFTVYSAEGDITDVRTHSGNTKKQRTRKVAYVVKHANLTSDWNVDRFHQR